MLACCTAELINRHAVTSVVDKRQLFHIQRFHARFRLLELFWYHVDADLFPLQSILYYRFLKWLPSSAFSSGALAVTESSLRLDFLVLYDFSTAITTGKFCQLTLCFNFFFRYHIIIIILWRFFFTLFQINCGFVAVSGCALLILNLSVYKMVFVFHFSV